MSDGLDRVGVCRFSIGTRDRGRKIQLELTPHQSLQLAAALTALANFMLRELSENQSNRRYIVISRLHSQCSIFGSGVENAWLRERRPSSAWCRQSQGRALAGGAGGISGDMLGCIKKITSRIIPKGTSARSCHQPLRFVSCNRLAPTAIIGSRVTSSNNTYSLPAIVTVTALPSRTARKNHQYSLCVALPLKSAYFAKHAFTASTIGIRELPLS